MPQLQFKQTRIRINLTGRAKEISKWPLDDIDSISTLQQKYNSLADYLKLPSNNTYIPKLSLRVKHHLDQLKFSDNQYNQCQIEGYWVKLYDDGYFIFSLELLMTPLVTVKHVNQCINDILEKSIISFKGEKTDFNKLSETIINELLKELKKNEMKIEIFELYSIISPTYISIDTGEDFNLEQIIGKEEKLEYDLYEAAIRRIADLPDFKIDFTRNEQKNVSLYKEDMVYLNYYNLFIYVADKPSHIPYDVYILVVEHCKIYVAKLICILNDISYHIEQLDADIPNDFKKLNKESEWVEDKRRRQLRAYEQFEKALDVSSSRIMWLKLSANKKFGIEDLTSRLNGSLNIFEATISRRVLLKQNQSLKNLTIVLTFLSILSIIVVIIGIIIGNNKSQSVNSNAHNMQSQNLLIDNGVIQTEPIDSLR